MTSEFSPILVGPDAQQSLCVMVEDAENELIFSESRQQDHEKYIKQKQTTV